MFIGLIRRLRLLHPKAIRVLLWGRAFGLFVFLVGMCLVNFELGEIL